MKSYITSIITFINKRSETNETTLKEMDSKLELLFERFASNETSNEEIASIGLQVFNSTIKQSKIKKYSLIVIKLLVILIVLFCAKSVDPLNRLTCMYGRLLLFKVCFVAISFPNKICLLNKHS